MKSSPPPQTPTYRPRASLDDSDSDGSQVTLQQRRSPLPAPARSAKSPAAPETAHNFSRPVVHRGETEHVTHSQANTGAHIGHRPRQRSQGYFEPSLSSARADRDRDVMPPPSQPSTSQMAAQAAYTAQHNRKRSETIPARSDNAPAARGGPASPPEQQPVVFKTNGMTYQHGTPVGVNRMAATAAANVAFPRSPLNSPGVDGTQPHASPKPPAATPEPLQLQKPKEGKSKMKLFSSKPKAIRVDKQPDSRVLPLPSPGKMGIGIHSTQALNRMMMAQSTTTPFYPQPRAWTNTNTTFCRAGKTG
jgi:hypothetical protein